MSQQIWKWIAAAIVLAVFIILGLMLPLLDWIKQLAHSFRSLGGWGVALFVLAYVVASLFCIPCMAFTVAGGFFFGPLVGFMAVHAASTIGAAAGFLLSRLTARARVSERIRCSERFHFFDAVIAQEGWKIVALLRMTPVNFGLANYIYGLTAIDFWHYMLASFFAMLPGHVIFTYFGSIGAEALTGQHRVHALELAAPALSMAATVTLAFFTRRILRRHEEHKSSTGTAQPPSRLRGA